MPATVWTLAVSWVLENGRRRAEEQGVGKDTPKPRRPCLPRLRRRFGRRIRNFRLRGDVGVATTQKLHKLQSKKRSGHGSERTCRGRHAGCRGLEESVHRIELVPRARKVVREAASGEARRDLGVVSAFSAADASDPGTCETMAVW
jgi:hypothetical protein